MRPGACTLSSIEPYSRKGIHINYALQNDDRDTFAENDYGLHYLPLQPRIGSTQE